MTRISSQQPSSFLCTTIVAPLEVNWQVGKTLKILEAGSAVCSAWQDPNTEIGDERELLTDSVIACRNSASLNSIDLVHVFLT